MVSRLTKLGVNGKGKLNWGRRFENRTGMEIRIRSNRPKIIPPSPCRVCWGGTSVPVIYPECDLEAFSGYLGLSNDHKPSLKKIELAGEGMGP